MNIYRNPSDPVSGLLYWMENDASRAKYKL
jgi:hypothetical protein